MKTLKSLKLTHLSKTELENKEMGLLIGGTNAESDSAYGYGYGYGYGDQTILCYCDDENSNMANLRAGNS